MLKGHGTLKTLLGRSVGGSNKRQRRSDEAEDVVGTDKEEGKALHKCKKTQSTLFGWKQPPKPPAAKRCGGQTVEKKNVAEASTSKPSTQPAASNNTVWKFTARKGKSRRDILQVQSYVVARRFFGSQHLEAGAAISFARHTDDRGYECFAAFNKGEPHGQLPEEVWSTMQPILEFVSITATVSSRPKRATSPLPVTLMIQFTAGRSASWQQTLEDVCKAATNVRQQYSETTGECLRKNFLSMMQASCELDKHALSAADLEAAAKLRNLPAPSQSLLLRLLLRKGPWFRVDSLWYEDVEDKEDAVRALHAAGFLQLLAAEPATGTRDEDSWKAVASVMQVNELWAAVEHFNMQQRLGHHITRGRRDDACRMLQQLAVTDAKTTLADHLLHTAGPCVSVEGSFVQSYKRITRLALLNEAQSVQQFLLADRGIARYPPYQVHRTRSAFSSVSQIEEYESAIEMAAEVDTFVDAGGLESAAPIMRAAADKILEGRHKWFVWASGGCLTCPLAAPMHAPNSQQRHAAPSSPSKPLQEGCCIDLSALECDSAEEDAATARSQQPAAAEQSVHEPLFLARFDAAWIYGELATMYAGYLEKKREYTEACTLLRALLGGSACPLRRGHWWCRLAINLEHTNQTVRALEAAESALADAWVRGGSRLDLQRRVLRLGKPPRRWRKPKWAAEALWEPPVLHIEAAPIVSGVGTGFMSHDGHSHVTVEDLALEHFALPEHGSWTGVHSESGVWSTLFGILLWDVLFAPVPDVFRSRFQSAPLDLCTDAFAPARADVLQRALKRISSGAGLEMLESIWEQHEGCWVKGVRWDRFGLGMLRDVVTCVGGPGLACMCECLAEDYAAWMSGLPDLLLWNTDTKKARLVEVKGPTDSLSQQQRAWLRIMCNSGLDAYVAKVTPPDKR